jgi:predicted YcjX-like family ATPase
MISDKIESLFTQHITIGVTGFSRAGKTLFIASLAQALLSTDSWKNKRGQGPLAHFTPVERGIFRSAQIRNDINSHLPQFPFIKVRNSLVTQDASWPEPTEGISHLVLDLDYWPRRWFKRLRHIQIELVDYPGEWLNDLPMLGQKYAEWSAAALRLAQLSERREWSVPFIEKLESIQGDQILDEDLVSQLSDLWLEYMQLAANSGFVFNQPGRALRPADLLHSPVLRLIPLPDRLLDTGLGKGMKNRFEEYRQKVIKPFYKDYFKHMDRQIILLDVLQALQRGESVFNELTDALKDTLQSFHYGRKGLLSWLTGIKTTHVLFAGTKADHVTRGDRANLEGLVKRMLTLVDENGAIRSNAANFAVMALASIRATEDRMTVTAPRREILYGQPAGEKEPGQWDPGRLPLDMPPNWPEVHFQFLKFEPQPMHDALHEGFPAINIGRAIDFLIGDDFK